MNPLLSFRKQQSTHEDFVGLWRKIESHVSRDELDRLLDRTVETVRREIAGKRVAFAWSGGKDSIVLAEVCSRAGIHHGVCVLTHLEYPAYMRWLADHKPVGIEIVNTGQDLRWLSRNLHMLFPQSSNLTARWFQIVQHRGQNRYATRERLDVLLFGRRRAECNYVGTGGKDRYTAHGFMKYSPLADWSHAHVLAYAHYYGKSLPPNYTWPRGFRVGTGPWAKRQGTGNTQNGWAEVFAIDRTIVERACDYVQSACEFMESLR